MKPLLAAATLALVCGCITTNHIVQPPPPAAPATAGPVTAVPPPVERLLAAFSDHDVDAMLRETHPDIEWYLVDKGTITLEVSGRDAFARSMASYFASTAGVRATVTSAAALNGRFVSFQERVRWTKKDGTEATQASVAVYELEGSLVRRAWYFPSEP